jgi:DNA-binding transcriptional MocR family regulator
MAATTTSHRQQPHDDQRDPAPLFMVMPPKPGHRFADLAACLSSAPSLQLQRTVAPFLREGRYLRPLRRMWRVYL